MITSIEENLILKIGIYLLQMKGDESMYIDSIEIKTLKLIRRTMGSWLYFNKVIYTHKLLPFD